MKKSEIKSLRRSVAFNTVAAGLCRVVLSHIGAHGPAITVNGNPYYINFKNNLVRDPVAIICQDWPMYEGPAIDSDNETIVKARNKACREYFPDATEYEYKKFEELLTLLQEAHDNTFVIKAGWSIREAHEEFGFIVRALIEKYCKDKNSSLYLLNTF